MTVLAGAGLSLSPALKHSTLDSSMFARGGFKGSTCRTSISHYGTKSVLKNFWEDSFKKGHQDFFKLNNFCLYFPKHCGEKVNLCHIYDKVLIEVEFDSVTRIIVFVKTVNHKENLKTNILHTHLCFLIFNVSPHIF